MIAARVVSPQNQMAGRILQLETAPTAPKKPLQDSNSTNIRPCHNTCLPASSHAIMV